MAKEGEFLTPVESLRAAGSSYAYYLLRAAYALTKNDFNGLVPALCECYSNLGHIQRSVQSLGYSRQMMERVAERKNSFKAVLDGIPEEKESMPVVHVLDEAEKEYVTRLLNFLYWKPLFRAVSKMSEDDLYLLPKS